MMGHGSLEALLYTASTWAIPVVIAITFHEAAHGFVAHRLGDDTAWWAGRVTFNPLRHVDPMGTVLLPLLLFLTSGFLFGYAKPVPVNFNRLHHPRRDMVWVALAGPATNVLLAIAAALLYYGVEYAPPGIADWLARNLVNALSINAVLCVFNLLPLPPLDGGRIAVGILPYSLARPLAQLEPYGMMILMLLFVVSYMGPRLGIGFSPIAWLVGVPTRALIDGILQITGQG
jgi:Zn-dependent protease